jgi:signal transduction histidine kinase
MLGYASMLSMVGELEPKQQEYVGKILGGIDQMTSLIDDLLGLGRLEAGVDLVLSKFRLEDILESVIEQFRQPAQARGMSLVAEIDGRLPVIEGDAALIRQAVANLTSNAIKYATESKQIIIKTSVDSSEVIVGVRDSGPGIAKKDQIRLFEKFYRVNQPGTDRVKGSGLGLALVKSIAERHGGRVWVESQPGIGSTFYIALPIQMNTAENSH